MKSHEKMRQILLLCGIGILSLILFFGIFKLFQNEMIYENSLGIVSENYERTGNWNDYTITKVKKPYLKIENENFLQWDAAIYSCITKRMYAEEETCYGRVRAAFFPLFPILWKITHLSPTFISILNYLIFLVSIAILVSLLLPENKYIKITTYIILITLPVSVIFIIPYSESLFLICMTIATLGFLKKKYPLYFIGILLMSMVRPATVFVLMSIISTEVFNYIKSKKSFHLFKRIFFKALPFLIGYGIVLMIQYRSSGSWSAFLNAQKYWNGSIQKISTISDWSLEGFGLNTFSIFFVSFPAVAYLVYLSINICLKKPAYIKDDDSTENNYLLLVSAFYLSGILLFTLITSGGNFHSFFRFTMCSPFFYISALIIISKLLKVKSRVANLAFSIILGVLCLYLFSVKYGGDRIQFSNFGLLMLILTFFYLINRRFLSIKYDSVLLVLIVLFNTIWNTYMLNVFFSNGWIFT